MYPLPIFIVSHVDCDTVPVDLALEILFLSVANWKLFQSPDGFEGSASHVIEGMLASEWPMMFLYSGVNMQHTVKRSIKTSL